MKRRQHGHTHGGTTAAEKWNSLCTDCRAALCDKLGFLNPIYAHYEFEQFQPHTQRDLAALLLN